MTHALAPAAPPASAADPARFLRLVLRVDSVSTAVMGLVLVAAAAPLGSLTGMPVAFAVGFGIFQLGGAACLALIAGYPVIPLALARTVVAVNAVCAVGCLVTAFADVRTAERHGGGVPADRRGDRGGLHRAPVHGAAAHDSGDGLSGPDGRGATGPPGVASPGPARRLPSVGDGGTRRQDRRSRWHHAPTGSSGISSVPTSSTHATAVRTPALRS